MASVSAKEVQELRRATGAGMMDAKRALEDAEGDFERARDILRERGLMDAKKRSHRVQTEGAIGWYLHRQAGRPVIGVLVELAAETDFVAKNDEFQQTANDIAMHAAAARPSWVTRDDVPAEIVEKERELTAAQAKNEGKPDDVAARIVEGKLAGFFADHVLYEQLYVRGEQFEGTIGEMVEQLAAKMGENISVKRFSRLQVGELSE